MSDGKDDALAFEEVKEKEQTDAGGEPEAVQGEEDAVGGARSSMRGGRGRGSGWGKQPRQASISQTVQPAPTPSHFLKMNMGGLAQQHCDRVFQQVRACLCFHASTLTTNSGPAVEGGVGSCQQCFTCWLMFFWLDG